MAATLEELLALLPDNSVGAIDAADLRVIVTELFNYTLAVQTDLSEVVVTGLPAAQDAIGALDGRITVLEGRGFAGEVDQLGVMVAGPAGWTSIRTAPGEYTVTHNLGTEFYAVAITPMVKAVDGYAPMVTETTAASFSYQTYSANESGMHDVYVGFVMAVGQG